MIFKCAVKNKPYKDGYYLCIFIDLDNQTKSFEEFYFKNKEWSGLWYQEVIAFTETKAEKIKIK